MQSLEEVIEDIAQFLKPTAHAYDKARAVHDWVVANITYDYRRRDAIRSGRDNGNPYRPEMTLERKAGICSDMTVLYIALAGMLGVRAQYAYVSVDQTGEKVRHACAEVDVGHRRLLADPVYRIFDARHQSYEIRAVKEYWNRPQGMQSQGAAAAGWLLAACAGAYLLFSGMSCSRREDPLSAQDTAAGVEFRTQHGALAYAYAPDAIKHMKDALLLHEAKNGELSGQAMLRLLVRTDADKNGVISAFEAQRLLAAERSHYGH
jgi:transglutaminase-like putative cysteine protease